MASSCPARCETHRIDDRALQRRSKSVASTADIGLDHTAQLHRPAQGDRNRSRRVAGERQLDGLAGQRLAPAGE